MKEMRLQLLISAVNQEPEKLISAMHVQSDAILVNQCDHFSYEEIRQADHLIRVYHLAERGVGLSRNHALQRADGDICLFADEDIEIPRLGDEVIDLILRRASEDFDWSDISPTIFGAVFESTLNPETRRSGGMHYTSIENIHKVIDPLFLDGLRAELEEIKEISVDKTRKARLGAF